jgi:hypothetical protein
MLIAFCFSSAQSSSCISLWPRKVTSTGHPEAANWWHAMHHDHSRCQTLRDCMAVGGQVAEAADGEMMASW